MQIIVEYSWCSNSICGIFLHVVTQPGEDDSLLLGHFELLWSAGFDKENSEIFMQFVQGYFLSYILVVLMTSGVCVCVCV